MKYHIRSRLNGWHVYDEQEELLGAIHTRFLGKFVLISERSMINFQLKRTGDELTLLQENQVIAKGKLWYPSVGTPALPSSIRPPMPVKLTMQLDQAHWEFEQNEHREICILRNKKLIGYLQRMLALDKVMELCDDPIPVTSCLLCFYLGLYMVKDNLLDTMV